MNDIDYFRAGRSDTSEQTLNKLAQDSRPKIRARVAENRATPQMTLKKLSRDSNEEVRIAVGCNPSTPLRVILRLAFDEHLDVRYSLAENPNLDSSILLRLANDENPYVSQRALKTIQRVSSGDKLMVRRRSRQTTRDADRRVSTRFQIR